MKYLLFILNVVSVIILCYVFYTPGDQILLAFIGGSTYGLSLCLIDELIGD